MAVAVCIALTVAVTMALAVAVDLVLLGVGATIHTCQVIYGSPIRVIFSNLFLTASNIIY